MRTSPINPPKDIPKEYQLKKLDCWRDSDGSSWLNWSAPRDGKQTRMIPSPNALIYKAVYSKVAFQPWTSMQLFSSASLSQGGGWREGRWACSASNPYPYINAFLVIHNSITYIVIYRTEGA
jgi:hypothetical protein